VSELRPGAVFTTPYPFVRDTYHSVNGPIPTWRPGVRVELLSHGWEEVADAVGEMHLRVISTHKPGHYPERVFYTRRWRDPERHMFGASSLKVATTYKFRSLMAGYSSQYRLQDGKEQP